MPNQLSLENSPYLLQHKDNPVDWYPWGPAALQRARSENKPIFLSIGYAACHWCHVMEHESFEDRETAAIMNRFFVSIKVDREERPDLDSLYMSAIVALTGQGGWPMSIFLTPEGQPFFGGTYFPPTRRYNIPAFREVLLSVAQAWQNQREQVIDSGANLTSHLQEAIQTKSTEEPVSLRTGILDQVSEILGKPYDWRNGGWGQAPKFPQPMAIEFLLNRAARGDILAMDMAVHTLQRMALGGMYDVVGGGFARYSTDNSWLLPHFEKMLYDNAQLGRAYLHAYLVSGNNFFRQICEETLDFVLRELKDPSGGFYSSLDADSEGEEGKFYIWTPAEISLALGSENDADLVMAAYGVTDNGNFEGKNVLQRVLDDKSLAEKFQLDSTRIPFHLARCHKRMLNFRSQRVPPATDDKVLVSWNGLMLTTLSEASRYLDRSDYLDAARSNARFLLQALYSESKLFRSWRVGKAQHNAYLEDYGSLILALLSLYQSDPETGWFSAAFHLTETMTEHFTDPQGGFFDTRDDHEELFMRPKDLQDNATPSGGALATMALLQMAAFTGRGDWRDLAERALQPIQNHAARYPTAFSFWLCGLAFAIEETHEVAILGDLAHPKTTALRKAVWSQYRPNLVVACSPVPPETGAPELLAGRDLIGGQPSAYVCTNFICNLPVTDPNDLSHQLDLTYPSLRNKDTGQ